MLGRASPEQILRHPYDRALNPNSLSSWSQGLRTPTKYYRNCVRYFYQAAPRYLVDHRHYFFQESRDFGEAAFENGASKNSWQDYGDRLLDAFSRKLSC